jgi:hypothetical protein
MFDLFVTFQASSAVHGGAPAVVAGAGQRRPWQLMQVSPAVSLPVSDWYLCRPLALPAVLQDKETTHRIIVGKDFYEPQGIDPQVCVAAFEAVFLARLQALLQLAVLCWRCGSSGAAGGGAVP